MASQSLWMEIALPTFTPLKENYKADVCIVGGGIAGLTAAFELAKAGKKVIVVEKDSTSGGQTARSTGHLTAVLDDRFDRLEKLFGKDRSRLAFLSHLKAIDFIEEVVNEERIECDFERVEGYLFLPPNESNNKLDKEFKVLTEFGAAMEWASNAPFSTSYKTGPCLKFHSQGQFHPVKYINGLIKAILKYGGELFNHTHISSIEDGSPTILKTASGITIEASASLIATCTPINDRFYIHTKQAAYRTYVIGATIPRGTVTKAIYWDTANPYHYIRIQKHHKDPHLEWLIVGGEDHKTGQFEEIENKYTDLEIWAKERFPQMGHVSYRWSGQVFEPVASLGFIGKNPRGKNVYIATGDSGNGLTHGTIAGILVPRLMEGVDHPWKKVYNPSRKTIKALPRFLKENANVSLQYLDWILPGQIKKLGAMKNGEGKIFRKNGKKLAVYKDSKGEIFINSAFCTHLGGCVRWNRAEKSWDCPCHGARYDGKGSVINGPTKKNLKKYI